MLGAGDFRAAQTTGDAHLDALGAQFHGPADGLLHGPAEGDALLQLGGDVFGHQLRVQVGTSHFHNADVDALGDHLLHLHAELLNLGAALAHNDARAGAVDDDFHILAVALDFNLRHAGGVQLFLQELSDVVIFYQKVAEGVVFGIPAGVPTLDYAHAKTVGIDFLAHN